MAKLSVKEKKEIFNLENEIDIQEFNGEIVRYKLSKDLINEVKLLNKKNQELLSDKMMKNIDMSKLTEKELKDPNKVIARFMQTFDQKELMKVQEEVFKELNIAEELFYAINGTPDKAEFKSWFINNDEFNGLGLELYDQFIAQVYLEFNELVAKSGLDITPR